MIRDLFVFPLKPLMILESETRRKGSVVCKQRQRRQKERGSLIQINHQFNSSPLPLPIDFSLRVSLGGCDERP